MYVVEEKKYFEEFTMYPTSGFGIFNLAGFDQDAGQHWVLDKTHARDLKPLLASGEKAFERGICMPCLFSVIMPAYNTERFVGETLRSLFAQKCQDFEIIFVDDGSTDSTCVLACKALEGWGGKYTVISQRNQGPGKARNKGMAIAEGDYLYFLDSDDTAKPDLFLRVSEMIKDSPDVVITGWERIDEDGKILNGGGGGIPCLTFPPDHEKCLMMHLEGRFPFWTGGFLVRRSLVRLNDLSFPVDLLPLEDTLFMSKCLLCAGFVITIPEVLSSYRKRISSITHGEDIFMKVVRANIGYSLRIVSYAGRRNPEMAFFFWFMKKRVGVHYILLFREYLRTGKVHLFRKALKEPAVIQVLREILMDKRHDIEDRVKALILLYVPFFFFLKYSLRYKQTNIMTK